LPPGSLIDVGINAAPLAAARTGVGRYIAGLLGALAVLRPEGLRARPLFAPGAPARGLRALVKRLPGAYSLAEAGRAVLLEGERRRGLTVYHETNHAAPAFRGPLVLTVHDLSTVLHPSTQEPARARHFSRALLTKARLAQRLIVPTEAIAREVVQHLGVEADKVTEDASFIDDLGADSLDIVELVMAFEEEFEVEIPDDAAEKITTVKDAITFIDEHKS